MEKQKTLQELWDEVEASKEAKNRKQVDDFNNYVDDMSRSQERFAATFDGLNKMIQEEHKSDLERDIERAKREAESAVRAEYKKNGKTEDDVDVALREWLRNPTPRTPMRSGKVKAFAENFEKGK